MQVVAAFVQVLAERFVIFSAKQRKKFGAGFWNIHPTLRLFVTESFARGSVISAKPSVCFHGSTISVERENVGRHGAWLLIARVAVDTVEDGIEASIPE